ncbi:hypothetical protein HKX48_002766 [Thoreauomyces humboldtii]|nr:hypothetical protein HKX48_002766 [Thoreauomyces humboldtii]
MVLPSSRPSSNHDLPSFAILHDLGLTTINNDDDGIPASAAAAKLKSSPPPSPRPSPSPSRHKLPASRPAPPSPRTSPRVSPRGVQQLPHPHGLGKSKSKREGKVAGVGAAGGRPSDAAAASCCGTGNGEHGRIPLLERLFNKATVTTMEDKYTVSRFIAEFYCTLTSPFFALPLLIYLFLPMETIPPLQHACIAGSCLAAFVSTLYHCTLWKVFSSADAAVATVTFYLVSYLSEKKGTHNPEE